jgi:hypothetical protein
MEMGSHLIFQLFSFHGNKYLEVSNEKYIKFIIKRNVYRIQ